MASEEQIEEIYKKKVAEPIQKHVQDLQQKQQEAIDAVNQTQQQKIEVLEQHSHEEDTDSDIILPSEKHKVTRFK